MSLGILRGIITGILLVSFLWMVAWAYSKKRAPDFDAMARAPLEEDKP
jgi:cytochrome c oxidase cbb3-type subunit 4